VVTLIMIVIICVGCLSTILLLIPKFTTGRILYAENFVPEFQVHRPLVRRDLSSVPVRIEIVHRKLYRVRLFALLKPLLDLLPYSYQVRPNKDGLFVFWAYPFDIVNIIIGEDKLRVTHTLGHRVNNFWPKYANFFMAVSTLFFPKLLHGECIEIPATLGKTCGYADKLSVCPDEEIDLMVSTAAETFSLELVRVGQTLQKVAEVEHIPGLYQTVETKFPSAMGCSWRPAYRYRMPRELAGGCYILKITDSSASEGGDPFIPLIVKPKEPKNRIAVIASTNTWHAYNSWGGQNYYINHTSFPSKYIISTKRPFDLHLRDAIGDTCGVARDHLLAGERFVWAWLEREGLGYDLYSDADLHSRNVFDNSLRRYDIILISTHNEYWSYDMINNLEEFMRGGGNVICLSGNALYKEVQYFDDSLIGLDGALFRYQNFPEEAILGVAHDARGFGTWAPYKVIEADHWVFKGTGLSEGDLFGLDGLNVSPDGKAGASAWETDKIYPRTPSGTVLLAKGTNPNGGGADLVIYEVAGGGRVFSAGSITFGGSLLVDEHTSRITRNVIDNFLTKAKA
jgi:N,N-dimethylformamidase beta subunit-like, C-terminal